jgi:hypothetical protein
VLIVLEADGSCASLGFTDVGRKRKISKLTKSGFLDCTARKENKVLFKTHKISNCPFLFTAVAALKY